MYLLWLRVALALYAAGSIAVFPAVIRTRPKWRQICLHLTGMGFFFHFVSVVEMLVASHHWLPVGVREVESLLSFAVLALYLLVWWLYEAVSLGIFALPMSALLLIAPAIGPDRYTFSSPTVRLGWLVMHIVLLLLAYTAMGFSLLASLVYLAQERNLKRKLRFDPTATETPKSRFFTLDFLPPLDTTERMGVAMLEFGFPAMTIGLVIGSVLAQETTLGAMYFADPKIIAAFISWGCYVLLLWARRGFGIRGKRAAWLTSCVFLFMLVVWATNVISRVHGFGAQ